LCAFIATLSIFHFSMPTHEEGIDLRATRSVRRTRSLQCQRSLIVAGYGATPSRHLLNYPRLRYLRCLLLLVGPGTFVPRERNFPRTKGPGNERSRELSFRGNESSRERKVSGTKVLHMDYSFLGTKGLGHEKSRYRR